MNIKQTQRLKTSHILICATTLALTSAAQAQTVINGSFTTFTPAGTKYATELGNGEYRDQTVINGWSATNTGIINNIARYSDGNALTIKGGKSSNTSTASQTINFASTGSYQLNFDTFTVPFIFENISSYSVTLKSLSSPDIALNLMLSESGIDNNITAHSHNFTIANAGNYVLTFANRSDSGTTAIYRDVFVDNVSIGAVPEPSSTALLGLSALGLLARRKR